MSNKRRRWRLMQWNTGTVVWARPTVLRLLDDIEDLGHDAVPCVVAGGDAWLSDDKITRSVAAEVCLLCPVLGRCRADAERLPPEFGVFGGVDYTDYGKQLNRSREADARRREDPERLAAWKAYRKAYRDDPEHKAAHAAYIARRYQEVKADPYKLAEMRERTRLWHLEQRRDPAVRARQAAKARERRAREKAEREARKADR